MTPFYQAMKVLAPDGTCLTNQGKVSCMDPATGESRVILVVPAKLPIGDLNGTIVLENGVGLACGDAPNGD